jgi:5,10-methylenetetrahydromethanopterin reductase
MRIGIIVDPRQDAWKLSEWGQLAERYGIHCLWLSNLMNSKDPFVNLALLAANTEKIELGPIAISPYELHPLMMTISLMTLNEISKGRAVIVVGGGGAMARNIGVDFSDPKKIRPVTSTRECVEIIKQISTGKRVTYKGKVFQVGSFQSSWAPNPGPVVYVGANKPKMLKMACEVSDGVMMTDIPPGYVDKIVNRIKDGLAAAGRGISGFRINNFYAWHVKDDYKDALKEARRYIIVRGAGRPEIAKTIGLTDEERELINRNTQSLLRFLYTGIPPKEIPEETLNKAVEGITIVGQVSKLDECVEKLHQFERKGLNEIALRVYGDATPSIKLIGEKVIPMLQ